MESLAYRSSKGVDELAVSPASNRVIRTLAMTMVPETSELDPEGWSRFERIVDQATAARPAGLQRQLRLFVHLVQWSAIVRYGRPFTGLDPERRSRWLRYFENHSVTRIRVGFWGLRTLILMGYYGQPEVAVALGYRPDPRGWSAPS